MQQWRQLHTHPSSRTESESMEQPYGVRREVRSQLLPHATYSSDKGNVSRRTHLVAALDVPLVKGAAKAVLVRHIPHQVIPDPTGVVRQAAHHLWGRAATRREGKPCTPCTTASFPLNINCHQITRKVSPKDPTHSKQAERNN